MSRRNALLGERLLRIIPADLSERIQDLLMVAVSIVELDKEDERALADAIAELIDDELRYQRIPEPYAGLLELADRVLFKILAMQAIRSFRRKWGRMSPEQRGQLLEALQQAQSEGEA